MQAAVHQLLVGVGEDPEREGLVDTPRVRRPGRLPLASSALPPLAAASRCCRPVSLAVSRRCCAISLAVSLLLLPMLQRVAKAWLDMTRGYRQECKR